VKERATAARDDSLPAKISSNGEDIHHRPFRSDELRPLAPATLASPAEQVAPTVPEEVFGSKLIWQAAGWVCVIVCLGIVAIAVSQIINPPRGKPIQTGVYGVIGLFGIGTLVSGYVSYRLAGQKYEVFSDRLVEWQCFKPTAFRWDQIREVYRDVHPSWTTYRVVTRVGREFILHGEIQDHKRLGELICERVATLLLPAALEELEAGRDVSFGPLRVNRGGVIVDGALEPWHRIGMLTFGLNPNPKRGTSMVSNMIHLRIGSAWVELGEIPNYRLFEELARHLFPASVGALDEKASGVA
jgi:hypothetical protein